MNQRSSVFRVFPLLLAFCLCLSTLPAPADAVDSVSSSSAGISTTTTSASVPKDFSLSVSSTGLTLKWSSVSGAKSYLVYRKTGNNGWSRLASVSTASYTDTSAKPDTTYTYTVRALVGSTLSDYSKTGISGSYSSTPRLRSLTCSGQAMVLRWDAVPGASGYRVFRKTGGSPWSALKSVSGTSYTDTNVTANTTYTYTVRAVINNKLSDYNKTGLSRVCVLTPKLESLKNTDKGLSLQWSKISGASKYAVYRKTTGSWSRVATVSANSYLDTSVKEGTSYTYTVRTVSGSNMSDYDHTGLTKKYSVTPALSSLTTSTGGLVLTWSPVADATSYRVFRKTSATSWKAVGTTSSCSYTDTSAPSDGTYTYTVRAFFGSSLGPYNRTGLTSYFLKAPSFSSGTLENGGISLKWSAVSGSTKYVLYRKASSENWKELSTLSQTGFTDLSVSSGKQYSYRIQAISKNGSSRYSNTLTRTYLSTPQAKDMTAVNTKDGVKVSWAAVSGADSYILYQRTITGNWTQVAASTTTSALSTKVDSGILYYYTVRAVKDGTKSGYESVSPISLRYIAAPQAFASNEDDGIMLSWNNVTNSAGYRVVRVDANGKKTTLADQLSAETFTYLDTAVASRTGETFTYHVYSLTLEGQSGGKNVLSASIPQKITRESTFYLHETEKTLQVGSTWDIMAETIGTISLSYSSDKTSVAKVSSSGIVTAVAPGTCTITVKGGNKTQTITVTVEGSSTTPDEVIQLWDNTLSEYYSSISDVMDGMLASGEISQEEYDQRKAEDPNSFGCASLNLTYTTLDDANSPSEASRLDDFLWEAGEDSAAYFIRYNGVNSYGKHEFLFYYYPND